MENNELNNIWKGIDSEINLKSKDELEKMLAVKVKKTIYRYLYVFGLSITICAGFLIFLMITTINRPDDLLYRINNVLLMAIVLFSIVSTIFSWRKLHNNPYHQPLKIWLEERIRLLSKWLTGKYSKLYLFIIPILFVMCDISIHVYYEHKLLVEVMTSEDTLWGSLFGLPVGLFVSYYGSRKIRKYYLKNLESLKELYDCF